MTLIRCYNELCIFNKEGICVQIEISINKGCMSELIPDDHQKIGEIIKTALERSE